MSKPAKGRTERVAAANAEETIANVSAQLQKAASSTALESHKRELSIAEQQAAAIRTIEDGIHAGALRVVEDSMAWSKIDPDRDTAPRQEWIDELGEERAWERFRVAKANWMSAKEAPIGIRTATLVSMGITKARATEKQAPRSLNVAFVQMTTPLPEFAEIIVERNK